jgi:hypothetical protein
MNIFDERGQMAGKSNKCKDIDIKPNIFCQEDTIRGYMLGIEKTRDDVFFVIIKCLDADLIKVETTKQQAFLMGDLKTIDIEFKGHAIYSYSSNRGLTLEHFTIESFEEVPPDFVGFAKSKWQNLTKFFKKRV